MAEGVLRGLAERAGLAEKFWCPSAGCAPEVAGWPAQNLCTRELQLENFKYDDYLIALDGPNLRLMRAMCRPERLPKLHLLAEYGSAARRGPTQPNPTQRPFRTRPHPYGGL